MSDTTLSLKASVGLKEKGGRRGRSDEGKEETRHSCEHRPLMYTQFHCGGIRADPGHCLDETALAMSLFSKHSWMTGLPGCSALHRNRCEMVFC